MKNRELLAAAAAGLAWSYALLAAGPQQAQPQVQIPQPGVPQVMTLEGEFVRVAYNNEGFVTLGYRTANKSVGEEWMLLEVGATMRQDQPNYMLTRDKISLETPDGKTLPLPSNAEFMEVDLRALAMRSTVVRDSVAYFPPGASKACAMAFFSEIEQPTRAYDQVELSWQRGCVGRLYFKIPGGIQYGQHWLNVQFKETLVRAPFRILTDDEAAFLSKNWKDIRKQVEDAFKKKG